MGSRCAAVPASSAWPVVPTGVSATLEDGATVHGDVLVGADGVHSLVRRTIDPAAPAGRYVGLTNFGGITRATPVAGTLEPEAWHFVFGSRAFFGAHPTPAGDVVWFANVPRDEISREERQTTTDEQWQRWLLDLVARGRGSGRRADPARAAGARRRQHLRPAARAARGPVTAWW